MARKSLKDVQGVVAKQLAAISTAEQRELLRTPVHFIPLNIQALEITLGNIIKEDRQDQDIQGQAALENFRDEILKFVAKQTNTYKNKIKITSTGTEFAGPTGVFAPLGTSTIADFTPAVVYENEKVIGLLFKTYDTTYDSLFRNFLNKELTKLIFFEKYKDDPKAATAYKGFESKKGFDIGHILAPGSSLSRSPLGERIKKLLQEVNTISAGQNASKLQQFGGKIQEIQNKLYKESSYGVQVEATLSKDVKNFLIGAQAVVVIIQERLENQYKYGSLIEGKLGNEILDLLLELGFSNSLEEDIDEIFSSYILTGTSNVIAKKSKGFAISLNGTKPKFVKPSVPSAIKIPASKTYKPGLAADNLVSLQALLDLRLVETIKQNMGTGNRRDILNLRSGRFAESVRVERLSSSRQGMITAFYSYMRNPYATFSSGGRQELPRTRDPKLLISRSIRQIAAQIVGNRLRAQLV